MDNHDAVAKFSLFIGFIYNLFGFYAFDIWVFV
jgi:hypothetical protein